MGKLFNTSGSMRYKFIIYVAVPLALVFIVFQGYSARSLVQSFSKSIEPHVVEDVEHVAIRLGREFSDLANIATMNGRYLQNIDELSEQNVYSITRETVAINSLVYGAATAFDEYQFSPQRRLFSPYSYRTSESNNDEITMMDIGDVDSQIGYDYIAEARDWWRIPLLSDTAIWTEPYFDEGAGNVLMMTYSVPFPRNGEFSGITTVDVSLAVLFETLGINQNRFNLIIDQEGKFIFHPDPSYILERNISDFGDQYNSADLAILLDTIKSGTNGLYKMPRLDIDDITWAMFSPIPSTNWYYLEFISEATAVPVLRSGLLLNFLTVAFGISLVLSMLCLLSRLMQSRELVEQQKIELETRVFTLSELSTRLEAAKNKADAAGEVKANFLASMSHEIRTPMYGILGMVDLLRQSKLKPEQSQMLKTVGDSGNALLTILNDILDISKIEAGKLELEFIDFSLRTVLESSLETMSQSALGKGLKLVLDIDPQLPDYLIGDPVRIKQVLINLIDNAIKFTEQGNVTIKVGKNENITDEKMQLHFSVIDQGIGISEGVQSKLFQIFSQAESSTTRRYGGTGLGLSICQRLVKMMGGEIAVNSSLGKGAEFYFIIPLKQSQKKFDASTEDSLQEHQINGVENMKAHKQISVEEALAMGSLILVAEDNPTNRDVIGRQLKLLGYACEFAEDGALALAAWRTGKYAMVLADCSMPNMDGFQFTMALREDEKGSENHTPVIAITASILEEEEQSCLDAGMDEVMSKPIDMKILRSTLQRWMPNKNSKNGV